VAVGFGELGTYDQAPVLKPVANQLCAERIGRGLQGLSIGDPEKSIIVFAEREARPAQLLFILAAPCR
jgi:hypothetical protein